MTEAFFTLSNEACTGKSILLKFVFFVRLALVNGEALVEAWCIG